MCGRTRRIRNRRRSVGVSVSAIASGSVAMSSGEL
jgi:hypothetical protein